MTSLSLCLLAALPASPPQAALSTVYKLSSPDRVVVRGQSPFLGGEGTSDLPPPGGQPFQPPPTGGPFLQGSPPVAPPGMFGDSFHGGPSRNGFGDRDPFQDYSNGADLITGLNGPQPYRFGWQPRLDFGYLPSEGVSRGGGSFQIFEFDGELKNTRRVGNGAIFAFTPQFGLRTWRATRLQLPSTVYRMGANFELATPANSPVSFLFGFNPSVNTDFEDSPSSDAFNFDSKAAIFYRHSEQVMYVIGAMYLDRVNDRVLPYAGVVLTPDDRTELRLMFPETRISRYVGNLMGDDKWIYASIGFHTEAYEIELERTGFGEKIEISDWRAVVGLRSDNNLFTSFIEAGIVFDRNGDFLNETPGFDISDGFILRGGLRF